jgi:peptidoglycan/LPS O-acetylase OafA/YrhL
MAKSRLFYIDNLRIFLIGLVVLHHFNISYGGPGSWYYNESEAGFPEIIPQAMFNITNQAFFMGMFFFISAFFTAASVGRKSTGKFLNDRLIRLGIPLVVFYFILNPLTIFIVNKFILKNDITYSGLLINTEAWGFGPMWFVEALLIFTVIYLLIRKFILKVRLKFPGTLSLFVSAIVIGVIQFFIRIWLPVGWSQPFTGFQFPFFIQYIFLFAFGIIAFQNNWLNAISFKTAKRYFLFAQAMILIVLPLLLYFGGRGKGIENFVGGVTWQSFSWAVWEQLVGFSLITGLLGIFKKYFDGQGKLARNLSASAYGVFILHPPLIVLVSAVFVSWQIPQLLKFMILAPLALMFCFLVAGLIRKIPLLREIL